MRRRIGGRVYDTAAAECLGRVDRGTVHEALYRDGSGECFLVIGDALVRMGDLDAEAWLAEHRRAN